MRVSVDGAWGLDIRRLCNRLGNLIPVNYIQLNLHFLLYFGFSRYYLQVNIL